MLSSERAVTRSARRILLSGIVMGLASAGALAAKPGVTQADTVTPPCSSGLAALTFDDGPDPVVTPAFVEVLLDKGVPATFFVVGKRVAASPETVLAADRAGFSIGNHSYDHVPMTGLTDAEIVDSLTRTQQAISEAGVTPNGLMRPPFGDTDERVSAQALGLLLTPTMWNVGTQESKVGITPEEIVDDMIPKLVPQRANIVLMHDRGPNALQTLAALPTFIDEARALGYCFARLGPAGEVLTPVPTLSIRAARVGERNRGHHSYLRFVLTLSEPTSVMTSVRVRTVSGTATPRLDYRPMDSRIGVPVGTTRRVVKVRVRGDNRPERTERLWLRVGAPQGLLLDDRRARGRIIDNDRRNAG